MDRSWLAAGSLIALSMASMGSGEMPTRDREYQPPFKPKSNRKADLLAKSLARAAKEKNHDRQ